MKSRILATLSLALSVTLLTSCGIEEKIIEISEGSTSYTTTTETVSAPPGPGVPRDGIPVDAHPEGSKSAPIEYCPYLNHEWVAETNGERTVNVQVDRRFDPPACMFWSYQDHPHLTVTVRTLDTTQQAYDMIDAAVSHPGTTDDVVISPDDPGAVVDAAKQPIGWNGYRASKDGVAVYAVRKGNTVVAVHTNQAQTVKAQRVAMEVIASLQL